MFSKSKSKKKDIVVAEASAAMGALLWVLGVLSTVASVIGVYKAHLLSTGLTFGTLTCSASLMALALNLFLIKKVADCWMHDGK